MATAVLLSGGVDSSVALRLLQREASSRKEGSGELRAFYLKIWLEDELADLGACPWEEDLGYAQAVCREAGVPLEIIPLQRDYRHQVVEYVVAELEAGRTPSPDLLCNVRIKFGAFLDHVDRHFDIVASGHYARTEVRDGRARLLRSPDPVKDQTYFLARLRPDQLARCRFPLGPHTKRQVRALAEELGLPNRHRPDSQGICFLGKIPFDAFVRHHLGEMPGEIREIGTEKPLGDHRGHWFFTIGQRRGLGLSGGPWYVVRKDVEGNVVYVTHRQGLESRARHRFAVTELHWLSGPPPPSGAGGSVIPLDVKLRHGPSLTSATLSLAGDEAPDWEGIRGESAEGLVTLERPDSGIAPGQFAVLYDGEVCLGSGVIL